MLASLCKLVDQAESTSSMENLLGIEGAATEIYFSHFGCLLKKDLGFSFQNSNKRSPRDPVNAVLSHLCGILAKDLFVTCLAVGFDPYLGFYHQPRCGRPALTLDLMEEFRQLLADLKAITLKGRAEDRIEFLDVSPPDIRRKPVVV